MDVIEVELKRALQKRGCPICRLVEQFEKKEIETLLYEHPNDPAVRREFRRSLGLCTGHAWKVLRLALSNPLLGPHGVSVIYEDVLRSYLDGAEEKGDCFLCRLTGEKEEALVESFADRLPALIEEYERSPSLLCRRHYHRIIKKIRDEELREKLMSAQRRKLEELDLRLLELIRSFDYRSEKGPNGNSEALVEVIEFLAGREAGQMCPREDGRERRWKLRLR